MHRSPIKKVAVEEFKKRFSDLLTIQSEISDFERSVIESTEELITFFYSDKLDSRKIERTARAAYHHLTNGSFKEHQKVCEVFVVSLSQVVPALNHVVRVKSRVDKIDTSNQDEQIEGYLNYYKALYERLMPIISAPIVFAYSKSVNSKEKLFIPRESGKVKLKALEKMEAWMGTNRKVLAEGINSHVRNSYSHETYKIQDGGHVDLWDENPFKPNKSWGPERWNLEKLIELSDALWQTALGMVYGLVIFSCNKRRTIIDRGWGVDGAPKNLRSAELKQVVESIADQLYFYIDEITHNNNELSILLRIRSRGIDQVEKMYYGGDGWSGGYDIEVKYVEVLIIEQVIGLMQKISQYIDDETLFNIEVCSPDKNKIGILSLKNKEVNALLISGALEDIRKYFINDTLGDAKMFVKLEGTPQGWGPATHIMRKPE